MPSVEGPRAARPEEFAAIVDLANLIFRTALGAPPTMVQDFPLLLTPYNREFLRVVLQDGQPVSHVGICVRAALVAGCRLTIGSIGAVCTDPAARGRGYASLALRDAIALLEALPADVMIVSGDLDLYRRAGCVDAGRTNSYTLRCGPALRHPQGLAISTAWQLDDLIRVHLREASRFVRPREDWEALLQPMASSEPGRVRQVSVAASAGTPLAYAVVDVARGTEGQPADARVIEYAGDAGAVMGLLAHCLAQPDVETLHVTAPMQDVALARLLSQVAAPEPGGIPETVRLIDPAGMLQRLQPYLAERLGSATAAALRLTTGESGTYTLRLHEESVVAPDLAALTWLLVGTHQRERLAWLDAASPALRRALDAAFPLPLPLPGLNWV